jgi:hypothetical protein
MKGSDDCSGEDLKRMVIQNDDHDQQNPGSSSRDMGDDGCVLVKGCDEKEHRSFEEKLFSSPNGVKDNNEDYPIRSVLSSFYWGKGDVQGIPDGLSDCSLCTASCDGCKGIPYKKAFDAKSTGYDKGDGEYTRVHRDRSIVNAMRAWVGLSAIDDEDEEDLPTQEPTHEPTIAPVEPTTPEPATTPTPTTGPVGPTPSLEACRSCITFCAPCKECTEGPDGSFAFGSCEKCWHCWDWDDDELEDDDDDMDKDCDALHKDHDWDDDEVRCLTNDHQDCRACWAVFTEQSVFV